MSSKIRLLLAALALLAVAVAQTFKMTDAPLTLFGGPLEPRQILPDGRWVFRFLENDCYLPAPWLPSGQSARRCGLDIALDASGTASHPGSMIPGSTSQQDAVNAETVRAIGKNTLDILDAHGKIAMLEKRIVDLSARPDNPPPPPPPGSGDAVTGEFGIVVTQVSPGVNKVGVDTATVPTFLTATAGINFGDLSQDTCLEQTLPLQGAATGDAVAAGWPHTLESGLTGVMFVGAQNTVTIRICKFTTGNVDPALQNFRATIVRGF